MPKDSQALDKLAALLQGSGARAVIAESGLPPSAIYDIDYRTAVIGLVFERFSNPVGVSGHRRMSAARLQLLQFAATRPAMIRVIAEWSKEKSQSPLALQYSVRMRHAFLSDTAHDDMMKLLMACGIFERDGAQLVSGSKFENLSKLIEAIKENNLFSDEREAVAALAEIKVTKDMLEGW